MRPNSVRSRPPSDWKALAARQPRRRGLLRSTAALAVAVLLADACLSTASAVSIVRDAEAEALVKSYLAPIFKAAGVRAENREVFLIPDQSFNAFVADGSKVFVNVGAIITSESPGELIGVLAHETAHLANGDQARFKQQLAATKNAALLASLLGLGAVAAGAATGVGGLAQAGTGLVAGTATVAQRSLLAYRRSQETQADIAAVAYLDKSGQSGAGMMKTLERFADETLFLARAVNPYVLSHPLPRDRVTSLRDLVTKSKFYGRPDPEDLVRRHRMVQAKLIGFTWRPDRIDRKFSRNDKSLEARYARAISAYLHGPLSPALKQIDGLIQSAPDNPYFWELKGQALLETGSPAESIAPLTTAVSLAPKSGLLRILLGQALVATEAKSTLDEAVKHLTIGLQAEPEVSIGYRSLARAHALKNEIALAELATAQGYFIDGKIKDAKNHATRAQAKLQPHSPAWLRADDIVTYRVPKFR
jgi:predicted Zn-dependent protease